MFYNQFILNHKGDHQYHPDRIERAARQYRDLSVDGSGQGAASDEKVMAVESGGFGRLSSFARGVSLRLRIA